MRRRELAVLWAEIEGSLSELDRVVEEIEQALKDIGSSVPSYRDKAAMGAFLHSFYNGIEIILKRIAEEIDQTVPVGSEWHKALLRRIASEVTSPIYGVSPFLPPFLHIRDRLGEIEAIGHERSLCF